MLDIRSYLINNFDGLPHKGKPQEISIDCPVCEKAELHFSFNVMKKKGHCLRCDYSVHSAVKLIMDLEKISEENARLFLYTGALNKSKADAAIEILTSSPDAAIVDDADHHVNVELPKEFIPMYDPDRRPRFQIPMVFKERNYSYQLIHKLNLGYCLEGCYAGRIIFPIACNGKKSFYARRMSDRMSQKYLNPPGSKHSELLYNYDFIPKAVIIFVVEGCTDVCRMVDREYHAVATSGKKISAEQIDLLVKKDPREIVLLFDGDALPETIRSFRKASNRLNVSYAHLPLKGVKEGKRIYYDPDDISLSYLRDIIMNRTGISRIQNAEKILKQITGGFDVSKCRDQRENRQTF